MMSPKQFVKDIIDIHLNSKICILPFFEFFWLELQYSSSIGSAFSVAVCILSKKRESNQSQSHQVSLLCAFCLRKDN